MKRMMGYVGVFLIGLQTSYALPPVKGGKAMDAPVATSCMVGQFTKSGNIYSANYSLKVTNNCGKEVDLQQAIINFTSNTDLNRQTFWLADSTISYPLSTVITSKPGNPFTETISLEFSTESWVKHTLANGQSFTLQYVTEGTHTPTAPEIILNGDVPPEILGKISIANQTPQPVNVSQAYAVVDFVVNGVKVKTVNVPWSGNITVSELSPNLYNLQPQTVMSSTGVSYQGTIIPASVTVEAGKTVSATLSYKAISTPGKINVKTPVLPTQLTGYNGIPAVTLKRADSGATVIANVPWNATTAVSNLENNVSYQLSSPTITYNGATCVASFAPASIISQATNPQTSQLSYTCSSTSQVRVSLSVAGLPCDLSSVTLYFQPNDGGTRVTKQMLVVNGAGSDTVLLADGIAYGVSSAAVSGYSPIFNPQPILAKASATETVSFDPVPQMGKKRINCSKMY